MTDSYNKEIDHRHQPTSIQNAIKRHKTITEIITGIHHLKKTTINVVPDGMEINNITGVDITDHHHLSVMVFNNIQDEITLNNIIVETIRGRHYHSVIIIDDVNMIYTQ